MTESPKHWWQNWSKTHAFVAERMFFPTSAAEIAQAIQKAEADQRPVRAVGGGWSFSDASLPGQVTTNRPNVYAVEAMASAVPKASTFPADRTRASIASIALAPPALPPADLPGSMVMLNASSGTIDTSWNYLAGGAWLELGTTATQGGTGDPNFLDRLAARNLRPIRAVPAGACIKEADSAGSLVMIDIAADPVNPNSDWFYKGSGVWEAGVSGNPLLRPPIEGTLQDLNKDHRLSVTTGAINLSPRAAHEEDSLAVLLSKQPATPATADPVYLINTRSMVSSLQQQLPSLLSQSAAGKSRFLFHVEGGITVAELGQLLAHQSPRLSLQAISGSPGASIAGALATGTHGAEFNWPLVTDTVKAVHLVGPGGLQWWIEGPDSIVDPQKLRVAYPDIPPERIIIGNAPVQGVLPQDWLTAAVVSLGSLGVVYSLVLEVVPIFGVREIVVQRSWGALPLGTRFPNLNVLEMARLLRSPAETKIVSARIVKLLQAGNLNGTGIPQADAGGNPINQYADLAINPNRRADGDYDCWIGNRQKTTEVPIDSQGGESGDLFQGLLSALGTPGMPEKIAQVLGFSIPSFTTLLDPIQLTNLLTGNINALGVNLQRFARAVRGTDKVDVLLDTFLTPMAETTAVGPQVAQAILSGILAGLLGTANCDLRSDKTGVNVGALGFPESGVMGTGLEIAMSPDDAFGFIQTEILDRINPQKPLFGYISIRLCSKTATLLGMQQYGDAANPVSVMIEVVAFGTPDNRTFTRDLQQRAVDRIQAGTLDAMLHWGLENELLTGRHLRKIVAMQLPSASGMSRLGTFKAVRVLLHTAAAVSAGGAAPFRVFDNNFTTRLELSRQALAFCDDNRNVIATWTPTSLFAAAGTPLIVGSRSFLKDLHVLNQSDHAIQVTNVRIRFDSPNAVTTSFLAGNTNFALGPNQMTNIVIEYIAGPDPAQLSGMAEVFCDDPIDSIVRIPFRCSVVANRHAELEIVPAMLDFGDVLAASAVERSINIRNTGNYAGTLIMDIAAGPFSFTPITNIGPGQTVALRVTYQPTARGVSNFNLGIDVQSPTDVAGVQYQQRHEIPLEGRGVAPSIFFAAQPQRVITVPGGGGIVRPPGREFELTLFDFGIASPTQTASRSFWIRNRGDAPLHLRGVLSLSQGSFGVVNGALFPATLQPGSEMEVACNFLAPQTPGMLVKSSLQVSCDDPVRGTAELAVQGKAGGPSLTRIDPDGQPTGSELLNLGMVPPSTAFTITFRSDGTEPVEIRRISMPANPGFTLTGGVPRRMPIVLAPAQEMALTVTASANPGNYHGQVFLDYAIRTLTVELMAVVT